MQIELLPLVTGAVMLAVGFILGWVLGQRWHELRRVKRVLRAKNPELWDLEHYVAVDEQEEKTTRIKRKAADRPPRPSQ